MSRQLTKFCKERGLVFVGQLSFDQLTEFRSTWKLCPRSASKALERLRSFLKFCVKCDWLPKNPAQDIDPPKVDDADVLPFSTQEVTKILKACDSFNGNGVRIKALSNLMLYSGLRISDASTISRAAFVETKGTWSVVLRTLKTRTQVSIPLPPDIAKGVLAIPGDHPFWSGASSPANCASVWQEAFRKLFAHAGIKNATPHRWRHTFSKNLLVAGVSLQTVSTLLGHRKLAITERYYARFVPERQDAIDSQVRKSWALGGHS
jgi:integrase/recombinase XerD